MFIYKITNKANGKVYIGKTVRSVDDRWAQHLTDTRRGSDLLFHRAIRKYGADSFDVSTVFEAHSLDELDQQERAVIRETQSYKREFGYNLTLGGDGSSPGELNPMFGKTHTDEVKQRLRELRLGTMQTEGTKRKISEAEQGSKNHFYGKHHTEDTRMLLADKARNQMTGVKRSPSTKQKIAEALRRHIRSDEHSKHISEAKKGKSTGPHFEESRQRMSEIKRLWWAQRKEQISSLESV